MIAQTLFAVSDNDSRPTCTGSLFEINEHQLRVVSVDGFRLAMRTEPITGTFETSFIVPKKTLEEILKLLEDNEDKRAEICATRRHIEFMINGCTIISRLIEGDFLDYNNAIPKQNNKEVKVSTRRMIEASERMGLLISDAIKSPVRCVFGNDEITFSCRTAVGSATDRLSADAPNEPVEIGFNNRYLMDAFRAVSTDEVRLIIGSPVNPVKVLPPDGESFLFLLLLELFELFAQCGVFFAQAGDLRYIILDLLPDLCQRALILLVIVRKIHRCQYRRALTGHILTEAQ